MIGKVIQRLRQEKRLSLTEVAERAGIAKSYLSSIERDIQGNPSIQVLEKICHVLGVSVPSLLTSVNEDDMKETIETLDPDWLNIVKEAQGSGINKEEFKEFLQYQLWRKQQNEADK